MRFRIRWTRRSLDDVWKTIRILESPNLGPKMMPAEDLARDLEQYQDKARRLRRKLDQLEMA